MKAKPFWVLITLLSIPTFEAFASGPEGEGWVQVTGGLSPARMELDTMDSAGNGETFSTDTGYQAALTGAFSPLKGLGVHLAGACSLANTENTYGSQSAWNQSYWVPINPWEDDFYYAGGSQTNFQSRSEQDAVYTGALTLTVYPGAWYGGAFIPGRTANADGWLLWPSLSLGYRASQEDSVVTRNVWSSNYFYEYDDYGMVNTNQYTVSSNSDAEAECADSQDLLLGAALPLTPFLTVQASYARNLSETLSGPDGTLNAYDTEEGVTAGLKTYLNLRSKAGEDTTRAFLPGLGRRGQLALLADWGRSTLVGQGRVDQTVLLAVGGAVSDHLGLHLGAEWEEANGPPYSTAGLLVVDRNDQALTYLAGLSWAFGNPADREDRP